MIDGLLDVPDQRNAPPAGQHFPRQRFQSLPLRKAGILKFIDEDMLKARAHTTQTFGHAILAVQYAGGQSRYAGSGQKPGFILIFGQFSQRKNGQIQKGRKPQRIAKYGVGRLGLTYLPPQPVQTPHALRPGIYLTFLAQKYAGEILHRSGTGRIQLDGQCGQSLHQTAGRLQSLLCQHFVQNFPVLEDAFQHSCPAVSTWRRKKPSATASQETLPSLRPP